MSTHVLIHTHAHVHVYTHTNTHILVHKHPHTDVTYVLHLSLSQTRHHVPRFLRRSVPILYLLELLLPVSGPDQFFSLVRRTYLS